MLKPIELQTRWCAELDTIESAEYPGINKRNENQKYAYD